MTLRQIPTLLCACINNFCVVECAVLFYTFVLNCTCLLLAWRALYHTLFVCFLLPSNDRYLCLGKLGTRIHVWWDALMSV